MRAGLAFVVLGGLIVAQPVGAAPTQWVDYYATTIHGPTSLSAGVSGTYELGVANAGNQPGSLELFIIFTGAVDQTGRIVAPGFDCEVRHDAGINAAIRCTKPVFEPYSPAKVTFQARGQAAGTGKIGAVLNPHRSAVEGNYNNSNSTLTFTIH